MATLEFTDRERPAQFEPDQFDSFENLATAFFHNASVNAHLPARRTFDTKVVYVQGTTTEGEVCFSPEPEFVNPKEITFQELAENVSKGMQYLLSHGLEKGFTTGMVGGNEPELVDIFFSTAAAGGQTLTQYLLDDATKIIEAFEEKEIDVLAVDRSFQLERLVLAWKEREASDPERSFSLFEDIEEIISVHPILFTEETEFLKNKVNVWSNSTAPFNPKDLPCERLANIEREDPVTSGSTSGTTGPSKTCTAGNGTFLNAVKELAESDVTNFDSYLLSTRKQPRISHWLIDNAHILPKELQILAAATPALSIFMPNADWRELKDTAKGRLDDGLPVPAGGYLSLYVKEFFKRKAEGVVPSVPRPFLSINEQVRSELRSRGLAGKCANYILHQAAVTDLLRFRYDEHFAEKSSFFRALPGQIYRGVNLALYTALFPIRRFVVVPKVNREFMNEGINSFQIGGSATPPYEEAWATRITRSRIEPEALVDLNTRYGRLKYKALSLLSNIMPITATKYHVGYGKYENTGAFSASSHLHHRLFTAGKPLAGEFRIEPDRELIIGSDAVIEGYSDKTYQYNARHFFQDNNGKMWHRTGDLAKVVGDGFIGIIGRKGEVKSSSGKFSDPTITEGKLSESPFIKSSFVLERFNPNTKSLYRTALIMTEDSAVKRWAGEKGIHLEKDLRSDKSLRKLIGEEIDALNQKTKEKEFHIQNFAIVQDFSEDPRFLTPKGTLSRAKATPIFEENEEWKTLIEKLFSDPPYESSNSISDRTWRFLKRHFIP